MGNSFARFKITLIRLAELAAIATLIVVLGEFLLSRSLYKDTKFNGGYLSILEEPSEEDRVLVFAPHEDDELLGAGIYIQRSLSVGADVMVCLITNGEYPEVSVMLRERVFSAKPEQFVDYGYQRQKETLEALGILGLSEDRVIFLGYPDHAIDQLLSPYHWHNDDALMSLRTRSTTSPYRNSFTPSAVHSGKSLLSDIVDIISFFKPTTIIAIHPYDIHIDHWSTYAFVKIALAQTHTKWAGQQDIKLINYMVHRPDWPVVKSRRPAFSLLPPKGFANLGNTIWYAFPAEISETLLKNRAMLSYRSQLSSLSPLLKSFIRANELFGEVPDLTWRLSGGEGSLNLPAEPVADHNLTVNNAYADISSMNLIKDGSKLVVELGFAKPLTRSVNVEIGFAFGGPEKSTMVGSLNQMLGNLTGLYSINGIEYYERGQVSYTSNGSKAAFSLPFPETSSGDWMMIWGRSYAGPRFIDQSMIHFIRIK